MGLKDWLTKKLVERQVKQMTSVNDAIDGVLAMKVKSLKKAGKPVNKENLMAGWGALKILGITYEVVEDRVEEVLTKDN